ncbi:7767_t:CDS:1 [Funneliformis mosseae]|uniref:7767_t:CDS:1 n=1 Tax=Funneliformis mosseae TaxID=27381 RepID=A0A9N8ZPP6_FUNMO|nr:7767_t:CDS:1 [Funneliformis mosseae]
MSPKYRKLFGQNYKKIFLECARTGKNFQDEHFPTNDTSLFFKPSNHHHGDMVEWKRCKDLTDNPHLFKYTNNDGMSGIINTDVIQGAVGNCWLISALGVLAAHPKLLLKVIPRGADQDWCHSNEPGKKLGVYHFRDTERHPGVFRFRFYRFGEWIEVVVDDYLPTRDGRLIYARSKDQNEMWVPLLEKAYAKLCKCYEALKSGSASDALVDLTGTIPETIDLPNSIPKNFDLPNHSTFSDIDSVPINQISPTNNQISPDNYNNIVGQMGVKKFVMMIQTARQRGALMSCSINALEDERQQERLPNGLIIGHAYGVTDIRRIRAPLMRRNSQNEIILIRLHNPWGEVEWNGDWSDRSDKWQSISKTKRKDMDFKIADDGDFWMSFEDWISNFSTLIICRHLNTSIFSFERRWHGKIFRGEWSRDKLTTGGCINNQKTFHQNPQYLIKVYKSTTLVIALMQQDHHAFIHEENLTIGFILLKIEENRKYRIHKPTYEVAGRVNYINSREVTARILLKRGKYVLIPSTFNVGEEGDYFMRLFSTKRVAIKELEKDRPKKKWWYPIIYWDNSYFVGTIRVKIMNAILKKPIGDAYIKIIFVDLKGRIKQRFITPKFKAAAASDGNSTEIGLEYVFYTRDPSTAGLIFQLYKKNALSKDKMLGEARILIDPYSKQDKPNIMWEITKTLTRVVRIPKEFLSTITTLEVEGEIPTNECAGRVEKKTERTVTRIREGLPKSGRNHGENSSRSSNKSWLQKKNGNGFRKKSKDLLPQIIDAGIGDLKIRLCYFQGLEA